MKNNFNSFLFENTDEKEIAKDIRNMTMNKSILENLSNNAREYARHNILSWTERMVNEVNEVDELINNY